MKASIIVGLSSLREGERGMALLAMIAVILPLMVMISAVATTMVGRNKGTLRSMDDERAFLAAESGIDDAIYRARISLLDPDATFSAEAAQGSRYEATATQWATDGIDNDGDGATDEADENIVLVRVIGTYRDTTRTLSARFAYSSSMPPLDIPSPLYFEPAEKLKMKLKGKKDEDGILVSGFDRNIDGSRPTAPHDVPAVTVANEEVLAKLAKKLEPKQTQYIEGVGLVEVRDTSLDVDGISEHVIENPDLDIERKQKFFDEPYGDSSTGVYKITHAAGKVNFKDDFSGAGVLVVDGDLKAHGDFRFDGLIIVRGKLDLKKTAQINGAIIVRGKKFDKSTGLWEKANVKLADNTTVQYSSQALERAASILPPEYLPRAGAGASRLTVTGWGANYARSAATNR